MYIVDSICISPQSTLDGSFLEGDWVSPSGDRFVAREPDYSGLVSPGALRRMGRGVRMAMGAGIPLLRQWPGVEGILLATGIGGLPSSYRFLQQMIEYEEGRLTPTQFVQGTPNSPAGQLAIAHGIRGYNTTHNHEGASFELGLLDALMLLEEGSCETLLFGAYEAVSDATLHMDRHEGLLKTEGEKEMDALLSSSSPGSVMGEGAAFFAVKRQAVEYQARIVDVLGLTGPADDDLFHTYRHFLARNGMTLNQVDALLLGFNGDHRLDPLYHTMAEQHEDECGLYAFKHAFGESRIAGAMAVWLAAQLLDGRGRQERIVIRPPRRQMRQIAIYNHFYDRQHHFVLMSV